MSGYDVMRIQNHLGIDFTELLEKYCELYVGRPSGIPLLRIKPKGQRRSVLSSSGVNARYMK